MNTWVCLKPGLIISFNLFCPPHQIPKLSRHFAVKRRYLPIITNSHTFDVNFHEWTAAKSTQNSLPYGYSDYSSYRHCVLHCILIQHLMYDFAQPNFQYLRLRTLCSISFKRTANFIISRNHTYIYTYYNVMVVSVLLLYYPIVQISRWICRDINRRIKLL